MLFGTRLPHEHFHPQRYVKVDLLAMHYITEIEVNLSGSPSFTTLVSISKDGVAWKTLTAKAVSYNSGEMIPVNKLASHIRYLNHRNV